MQTRATTTCIPREIYSGHYKQIIRKKYLGDTPREDWLAQKSGVFLWPATLARFLTFFTRSCFTNRSFRTKNPLRTRWPRQHFWIVVEAISSIPFIVKAPCSIIYCSKEQKGSNLDKYFMGNNGQWDKESFTATPNYYYHYVILIEISGFAAQIVNASCYPLSILLIHKVFPCYLSNILMVTNYGVIKRRQSELKTDSSISFCENPRDIIKISDFLIMIFS